MSGIRLQNFYFSFLVLLGVLMIPFAASTDVVAAEYSSHSLEKSTSFSADVSTLSAKAESLGAIPIIVRLKVGFIPEGALENSAKDSEQSKNKVDAQRKEIKKIADKVIGVLSLSSLSVVNGNNRNDKVMTYEIFPYISLKATSNEINLLSQSEDVISIVEDIPMQGTLSDSIPFIKADVAHAMGYIATGQTIAVIDSGVRTDHEFFAGKIVSEACFSGAAGISLCPDGVRESTAQGSGMDCPLSIQGCGHGTHVAGIAVGFNGQLTGVGKDAKLIAIKTASNFNNEARHYGADMAKALERVYQLRNNYQIAAVNMSIGGGDLFQGTCDNVRPLVTDAINQLHSSGIATIISAGNSSARDGMSNPACISNAISVGNSTDGLYNTNGINYPADSIWADSNISANTDLLAPGTAITSSTSTSVNSYGADWGTSMAAPHVAGAFAILRSKNPSVSIATMLNAFKATGVSIFDQRSGGAHTTQRINVEDALAAISSITLPSVSSPIANSTLSGSTQLFNWSANGTNVTQWWVYAGSSVGARDYYDSGSLGQATSTTVTGIATDGNPVYVRLWYKENGIWKFVDSSYTAATIAVTLPEITSPAPGSTLSGTNQNFNWTANDISVSEWWVYAGSSAGAFDYYNSGTLGTANSVIVTGLPTDGSTVYLTLWYKQGSWKHVDATYTAALANALPAITAPTAGSTLSGSSQTFSWLANGTNVTQWWLYAGSTVGANDYYDSGSLGTAGSANVTGLPTDESTVHIRLWYKENGTWKSVDSTYTAASPVNELIALLPSGTISTIHPTFKWKALSTVTNNETYLVYARDADGVLQVWNAVTANQAACGSGTGNCYFQFTFADFAEGSGGYWKFFDNDGNESNTLYFTIELVD